MEYAELRSFPYPIDSKMQKELNTVKKRYVSGRDTCDKERLTRFKHGLMTFAKLSIAATAPIGVACISKNRIPAATVSAAIASGLCMCGLVYREIADSVQEIKYELEEWSNGITDPEALRERRISKILRARVTTLDNKWRRSGKAPKDAPPLFFNRD